MRILKIKNQQGQPRYGELVALDDDGHILYDIIYDGQGYHNYPSRVDNDYRTAKSELATYGSQVLKQYLNYLQTKYNTKVINRQEA